MNSLILISTPQGEAFNQFFLVIGDREWVKENPQSAINNYQLLIPDRQSKTIYFPAPDDELG